MNKSDLVASIAESANLSKATAEKALNSFINSVEEALSRGETVTLVGFGTFSISERGARTGRNPQTGKPLQISAQKKTKFKPGKRLADSVK
jgi:DNA-binding protein HU-beta